MAAAAVADGVSLLLMRRSILTEKIARRGRHILQEFAVDPLELLQAGQIMTPDPETLPGSMPVAEAAQFFAEASVHRSYPVIDEQGRLLGLVSRTAALRWRIDGALPAASLADPLSDSSFPTAYPETPLPLLSDMIVDTSICQVPIVAPKN